MCLQSWRVKRKASEFKLISAVYSKSVRDELGFESKFARWCELAHIAVFTPTDEYIIIRKLLDVATKIGLIAVWAVDFGNNCGDHRGNVCPEGDIESRGDISSYKRCPAT